MMELMTTRHQISVVLEEWFVGNEGEMIRSTGCGNQWGLIHQLQGTDAPVDCPPVDSWLFLLPEGIVRDSIYDSERVQDLTSYVGRKPHRERAA
jgi:hypothetical protein